MVQPSDRQTFTTIRIFVIGSTTFGIQNSDIFQSVRAQRKTKRKIYNKEEEEVEEKASSSRRRQAEITLLF